MLLKRIGKLGLPLLIFFMIFAVSASTSRAEGTPTRDEIRQALRQMPLFAVLDDNQLHKVAEAVEMHSRRKGERIIFQGMRIGKMFIVLDSKVQIRINRKLIVVLPAASLVGEIEFLIDVPATADVVLDEPSRVLVIYHGPFRRVMDDNPDIGYKLMTEFAKMEASRLRATSQRNAN